MRFLSFILFLVSGFGTLAQDQKTDSLLLEINRAKEAGLPDSAAKHSLELTYHYYDNLLDSLCIVQADKTIDFSGNKISPDLIKTKHLKAKSLFYLTGEFEPSLAILKDIIHDAENFPEEHYLLAIIHDSYGSILSNYGKQQKALRSLERAKKEYYRHDSTSYNLLNIYSNLVAINRLIGNYEEALLNSREGIDFAKSNNYTDELGTLYYNYATIYFNLDLFEDAKRGFLKAIKYQRNTKNKKDLAISMSSLGNTYGVSENIAELDSALMYLLDAEKALTELKDYRYASITKSHIAEIYRKLGKNNESLNNLNDAIHYLEQTKDTLALAGVYTQKSSLYATLSVPDSAIHYALRDLELTNRTLNLRVKQNAYKALSEGYLLKADFKKANYYLVKHYALQDTLYKQELDKKIAKEQTLQKVESEQIARLNAEIQAELSQERSRMYLLLSIGLVLVLGVLSFLLLQLYKTRKKLQSRNIELKSLNTTKDKFFGIIAHDLRSPMTALESVGEQMDFYLEKGNTDKLRKLGSKVESTSKSLSSLLNNLLNWALIQTGQIPYNPVQINLSEVMNETSSLYSEVAKVKNIELIFSYKEPYLINADEHGIETIIRNLVSNAIKFTPNGGRVKVNCISENEHYLISVSDSGVGMTEKQCAQLFSLTKKSEKGTDGEKGTGLGLLLCKELVELHGGSICAESKKNVGSTFSFTIPK